MHPTRTGSDRLPTDVRTDPPALLAQVVAVLAVPGLLLLASYPGVALVALAALVVATAVASRNVT